MKSWEKRFKYIKLCLISPALEIFIDIIYITSFIIIFTYFWQNGKYYKDNQILKFTESYIDYNSFNDIKTPTEFEIYLSNLINKLFTINTNNEILPIFIPLNPIRLSQFSNKGCEENNFNYSCHRNFTCIINSLINAFYNQCGLRYIKNKVKYKENTEISENFDEIEMDPPPKQENKKLFLEDLVISLPGYYSKYDLLNGGEKIDLTNMNINQNISTIKNFIYDKNVKLIALQINLKVPSNNNYVDIILGLEMNQYFHDIKKIISIDVYNDYRPSNNMFLFIIYNFYFISTIINVVKLIYEMFVKIIWSVHLFFFLNEIFDVLFIIFSVFYITLDQKISFEPNLKEFETHLIYSSVRKYMKIIIYFLIISIPLRFISLISWCKWISQPFIILVKVLFRMLPGIILSFFLLFIFLIIFSRINHLIFQDIFSEYQTFYYCFLNIFNYKILNKLYDEKNNAKIFHNLAHSKYVFIILLFEYIFNLICFALLISLFVYLFKNAESIETPKQENEYLNKLKHIKERLNENFANENVDLFGIKKQILWLKLVNKSTNSLSDTNKYELILFKNSNQIISFLKYLFALKPELQFKNLVKKLNIVVEVDNYDNMSFMENEVIQINKLADWMTYVGTKILLIIYCQTNFSVNFQMKLYNTYNLIKFINNKEELEKIINEKDYGKFNVENSIEFTINSIKKNIMQSNFKYIK